MNANPLRFWKPSQSDPRRVSEQVCESSIAFVAEVPHHNLDDDEASGASETFEVSDPEQNNKNAMGAFDGLEDYGASCCLLFCLFVCVSVCLSATETVIDHDCSHARILLFFWMRSQ